MKRLFVNEVKEDCCTCYYHGQTSKILKKGDTRYVQTMFIVEREIDGQVLVVNPESCKFIR